MRAGLAIQQMLGERSEHANVRARIGIHTGLVIVGEIGAAERRETLATGSTTNLAARIEGQAAPGTVVISEATHRLAAGLFVTRELGQAELQGISETVKLFEVQRAVAVRSRLDRTAALTPLIGRDRELGLLLDRARSTLQRSGGEICFAGRERRVRGMTLLAEGREAEAEASLREALVFTTRHGARIESLLCVLELARLARDRSDAETERSRLQGMYAAFDQGLETRPLRRVRVLLDELG